MMRFTAADLWVTYSPLYDVLGVCYNLFFLLFLFFLCCYLNAWTENDTLPPITVKRKNMLSWTRHIVVHLQKQTNKKYPLKLFFF